MKARFNITGFVMGLILVAMIITSFVMLMAETNDAYNPDGDNVLSKYQNITDKILNESQNIKLETKDINEDGGNILTDFIDIVAIFYKGGWNALKTSLASFELFESLMSESTNDVPAFKFISNYLVSIIMIMLFLGVAIAALLKWRV